MGILQRAVDRIARSVHILTSDELAAMVKAAEGGERHRHSRKSALQVPAVTNGLSFIANGVAGLPFRIYQRTRDGQLELVRGDPLEVVLNERWSMHETSAAARQPADLTSVLLHGDGYAYLGRNRHGQVRQDLRAPAGLAHAAAGQLEGRALVVQTGGVGGLPKLIADAERLVQHLARVPPSWSCYSDWDAPQTLPLAAILIQEAEDRLGNIPIQLMSTSAIAAHSRSDWLPLVLKTGIPGI